jgi:hypothetical protein
MDINTLRKSLLIPALFEISRFDEKKAGGKPRYRTEHVHPREKGTEKQCVFAAVEQNGPVTSIPIANDGVVESVPVVYRKRHLYKTGVSLNPANDELTKNQPDG